MNLLLRYAVSSSLLCIAVSSHAQKPSAEQVIQNSLAAYAKAKTYQGTLMLTEKTAQGTNHVLIKVQAEGGAKGGIKRHAMTITTNSRPSLQILDDGKSLYTINPEKKAYTVTPHRRDEISGLFKASLDKILLGKDSLKLSEAKIGNSRVYVITGTPSSNPTKLVINATNYQVESMHVTRTQGRRTGEMKMLVSGQKFNAPIPASLLVWKAPAGYKKL